MEKSKFNFFKQIFYAAFKPLKYYRLAKVSGGRLTGFIFLFVFIISLFITIPLSYIMFGPNGFTNYIRNDLPAFEFADGKLHVDQPYEKDVNGTYIKVDTNVDAFSVNDIDYSYDQNVLLSKTNLVIYRNSGREEYNFSDYSIFNLDNHYVTKRLPVIYAALIYILVLIYIFMVGFYYLAALLYSFIGKIVATLMHAKISYSANIKIAVYSEVPVCILLIILNYLPLAIPGYILLGLSILITSAYVVYGTMSYNTEAAREEELNTPPEGQNR